MLGDVGHPQEFVHFEAFGGVGKQLFQLAGGLRVAARFVICYSGLVLAIELFFLWVLLRVCGSRGA